MICGTCSSQNVVAVLKRHKAGYIYSDGKCLDCRDGLDPIQETVYYAAGIGHLWVRRPNSKHTYTDWGVVAYKQPETLLAESPRAIIFEVVGDVSEYKNGAFLLLNWRILRRWEPNK